MKKITLALVFLTFGMQAQEFPSPYCNISASGTTTEEITSVLFDQITIVNTDISSILVNKTATNIEVLKELTYTITVKGNTKGNFDNDIVAFIDWNHNNILDDEGEIYEIATITNSNGNDAVSATMEITIPTAAITGLTRVRITKIYGDEDSPALINPCAIEMDAFGMGAFGGYGQALDFNLQIGTLSNANFDFKALSVYPVPTKDILNVENKSIVDQVRIYNLLGQEVYVKATNSSNFQLDLSTLSTGSYIAKLFSAGSQHTVKIIKQ